MCRFINCFSSLFSSVRMAVIDWWNGPLSLVVIFFALCLLLLTWSIAGVACRACHSSGTFFSLWHTHTHTHTPPDLWHLPPVSWCVVHWAALALRDTVIWELAINNYCRVNPLWGRRSISIDSDLGALQPYFMVVMVTPASPFFACMQLNDKQSCWRFEKSFVL